MRDCTSISDFYAFNDSELTGFAGKMVSDPELRKDIRQSFYCKSIEYNTLQRYDPAMSKFSTYIWSCVRNLVNCHFQKEAERVHLPPAHADTLSACESLPVEATERVERFRRFIEGSLIGSDGTGALDFFDARLHGRPTGPVGQSARNSYSELLKRFKAGEKLAGL
jgi:DNA-directed RNA polymerase specialized sigma24 family protein